MMNETTSRRRANHQRVQQHYKHINLGNYVLVNCKQKLITPKYNLVEIYYEECNAVRSPRECLSRRLRGKAGGVWGQPPKNRFLVSVHSRARADDVIRPSVARATDEN